MPVRLRFPLYALLVVFVCASLALGLLSALNLCLDLAPVHGFDLAVQQRVHAHASTPLTAVMLALTWIGSIKIFASALALVLCLLAVQGRLHTARVLGGAMLGALLLNESLKLHFHRQRPQLPWSIGDEHTFSFPSGHSLFSVVLYGTLAYLALCRTDPEPGGRSLTLARRCAILIPAVLLPLGIGFSRIYLGMHFPTDVAAGYLTGLLWLAGVIALERASRPDPLRQPS